MKGHYGGFCIHMPRISYMKYPTQKRILPFCSAGKGLASAMKFFRFRLFLPWIHQYILNESDSLNIILVNL